MQRLGTLTGWGEQNPGGAVQKIFNALSIFALLVAGGALFSAIGIASDSAYAIAAGKARDWLATSAKRLEVFRGLGGLALTLLGLYMLYEALVH